MTRTPGTPIGGGWTLAWPVERARNPFWQAREATPQERDAQLESLRVAMRSVYEECR